MNPRKHNPSPADEMDSDSGKSQWQVLSLKTTSTQKLKKKSKGRVAMLGGGDIAFPLIFAGVMLKEFGLWQSLIIPFFALAGLVTLLLIGKEKKFYPAMPFISAGCLLGLGLVYLISSIL